MHHELCTPEMQGSLEEDSIHKGEGSGSGLGQEVPGPHEEQRGRHEDFTQWALQADDASKVDCVIALPSSSCLSFLVYT